MGRVEVWNIGWLGLFSSTWIGLRVLIEMGFCFGVETKSELGYWGLPVQIEGCGGLVLQLDHRLRIDGRRWHLQQIEDEVSASAGGFKEGGFVGEYDQLWFGFD